MTNNHNHSTEMPSSSLLAPYQRETNEQCIGLPFIGGDRVCTTIRVPDSDGTYKTKIIRVKKAHAIVPTPLSSTDSSNSRSTRKSIDTNSSAFEKASSKKQRQNRPIGYYLLDIEEILQLTNQSNTRWNKNSEVDEFSHSGNKNGFHVTSLINDSNHQQQQHQQRQGEEANEEEVEVLLSIQDVNDFIKTNDNKCVHEESVAIDGDVTKEVVAAEDVNGVTTVTADENLWLMGEEEEEQSQEEEAVFDDILRFPV